MALTLKDYSVGALTLLLLASLGFNIIKTDTHFCRDLEIGMSCDHLSSTGLTCYPFAATRAGNKYCASGWELIAQGIEDLPSSDGSNIGSVWKCSQNNCTRIK